MHEAYVRQLDIGHQLPLPRGMEGKEISVSRSKDQRSKHPVAAAEGFSTALTREHGFASPKQLAASMLQGPLTYSIVMYYPLKTHMKMKR